MMPTPSDHRQDNPAAAGVTAANPSSQPQPTARVSEPLEQINEINESILRNVETIRSMQDSIWGSMQTYSSKLGWGLSGIQPECWTLLDTAVDELVWRREQAGVLRQMANDWLNQSVKAADAGEAEVVKNCACEVLKALLR